jgi:hypothetical protein
MYKKLLAACAVMNGRQVLIAGFILAILFEAITVGLRFGLHLQSTRDTASIGHWTCGLRIHHGYIGVFLLPLAWCFPRGLRHALWMIGIGLILSDLAHHFLVLWPFFGDPQFDLYYPDHPFWRKEPAKPQAALVPGFDHQLGRLHFD